MRCDEDCDPFYGVEEWRHAFVCPCIEAAVFQLPQQILRKTRIDFGGFIPFAFS